MKYSAGQAWLLKARQMRMVVVDRDRVVDLHVFHGPANVGDVLFEFEFRRMDADHHQSLVLVFLGPGADIRKLRRQLMQV